MPVFPMLEFKLYPKIIPHRLLDLKASEPKLIFEKQISGYTKWSMASLDPFCAAHRGKRGSGFNWTINFDLEARVISGLWITGDCLALPVPRWWSRHSSVAGSGITSEGHGGAVPVGRDAPGQWPQGTSSCQSQDAQWCAARLGEKLPGSSSSSRTLQVWCTVFPTFCSWAKMVFNTAWFAELSLKRKPQRVSKNKAIFSLSHPFCRRH